MDNWRRKYIVTLLLEVSSPNKKQAKLDFIDYLKNRGVNIKDVQAHRVKKFVGVGR